MDKKEKLIEELNKLREKCEKEREKRQNKLLFFNIFLNKLKKNNKYFVILSLIIFLFKNFDIGETNYFQSEYFIDALGIGLFSLFLNASLSLYFVSKDKKILKNYRTISKRISINLLFLLLIFIIYYLLRVGGLI